MNSQKMFIYVATAEVLMRVRTRQIGLSSCTDCDSVILLQETDEQPVGLRLLAELLASGVGPS